MGDEEQGQQQDVTVNASVDDILAEYDGLLLEKDRIIIKLRLENRILRAAFHTHEEQQGEANGHTAV